jgi:hypothetical protein
MSPVQQLQSALERYRQVVAAPMSFQADRHTFVPGQNQYSSLPPLAGTSTVRPGFQEQWTEDAPVNKCRKTTNITKPTNPVPNGVPITT